MTTPRFPTLRQPLPTGPDLARRRALLAIAAMPALGAGLGALAGCARHEPAPSFDYTLLDGTRQASASLRGQVVLVNFWATSCAVCVREMPQFVALHQRHAGQGLQTLAVAMQHDAPAMVAEFAQRRALPFGVVIDNTGAIARAFGGVRATPTTLLIDRSHFEVWRHEGEPDFARLQARIGELLGGARMIGRLSGVLVQKAPPLVLLDVHGVGYEVDVPMSTFYNLPALGEAVVLLTHFVVREDAQVLFGFLTEPERATFRQLVKISGVGPRTALSILSGLSVDELAQAVARQDGARLVKVPGIGKKTAERLLLELKGKLGPDLALPSATPASDHQADITQALQALGYSEREAAAALKALPADVGVSEGIKLALKALNR